MCPTDGSACVVRASAVFDTRLGTSVPTPPKDASLNQKAAAFIKKNGLRYKDFGLVGPAN